jgi:hypothetical protein
MSNYMVGGHAVVHCDGHAVSVSDEADTWTCRGLCIGDVRHEGREWGCFSARVSVSLWVVAWSHYIKYRNK